MQRFRVKKAAIIVLVAMSALVMAACEMSPEMMQMLMGMMMGFCGNQGGAYNGMYGQMFSQMGASGGGQQAAMGYMMGSQMRDMYMASSNNTQGGRQYSGYMQQNGQMVNLVGQMAMNYNYNMPIQQQNPSPTVDTK